MVSNRQFSWRRSGAWALSLAVHLSVIVAMTVPREPVVSDAVADASPSVPDWVPVDVPDAAGIETAAPPANPQQEATPAPDASATADRVASRRPRPLATFAAPSTMDPPVDASAPGTDAPADGVTAPVARTIAYLDDEARALLPQENLYSAKPPPREGDYYTPGDGSEDDVFYRPRALDPNPSRFAHAWRPRGNLIDDWLERLVEKATGKVSIPLNAKFSLVCGTVAGIAGSCAIVRNGGTGVIVQRPPPAPWDRSNRVQCRELREALDTAEEAAQVAYFLDRLSAVCSGHAEAEGDGPAEAAANDEARREAGLPEEPRASGDAAIDAQRVL